MCLSLKLVAHKRSLEQSRTLTTLITQRSFFWQMEMAKYRKGREEEKLHILKTETADEH